MEGTQFGTLGFDSVGDVNELFVDLLDGLVNRAEALVGAGGFHVDIVESSSELLNMAINLVQSGTELLIDSIDSTLHSGGFRLYVVELCWVSSLLQLQYDQLLRKPLNELLHLCCVQCTLDDP